MTLMTLVSILEYHECIKCLNDNIRDFIADCEYVGHVVPIKKIVSRDSKRKTSKKQGNTDNFVDFAVYFTIFYQNPIFSVPGPALLANTSPLLQVDPSQQLIQQLMLQQQQQYQMLENLCTFGMRPTSAAAGAPETTSKAALDGSQKSPNPKNPGDEAAKDS